MKILELRFKNLNSLAGEWVIDLTSPEYLADGIFAITGPTGAGKSTILDAICLALYGATPRLGRITKSGNEIMSRQTGECFAEVTFAAAAGRFRCHWSQHKSHKRPDGNLIETRHEIADAVSGKILESKKREVATVIEQKTGMNFERFTRSSLLAQGEFDTFLKADSDKRAPILEQITGSEIYSEISKKVHEHQRNEQEKLRELQAETSGITILSESQESEIIQELARKQKSAATLAVEVEKIEKAITWHQVIERIRLELDSLVRETQELQTAIKIFQPERERLGRARKAAELEGIYATLILTRKQQDSDLQGLKDEELQLPKIMQKAGEKEEELKKLEQLTIKAKKEQSELTPLIQKIRTLDQQLSDRKNAFAQEELEAGKVSEEIAVNTKSGKQIRLRIERAQKDLTLIQADLEKHAGNELLLTEFAGIKEQLSLLLSLQEDISTMETSRREAKKQLQATTAELAIRSSNLITANQKLEKTRQQVRNKKTDLVKLLGERLLREYRIEKETRLREMAFKRKIADLQTYREQLEEGRPCPLCGACEHPYARNNVPETAAAEKEIETLTVLIDQAEKLELEIKKLESKEKEGVAQVAETAKLEAETGNEKNNVLETLSRITDDLNRNQTRFTQLKEALSNRLRPLGFAKISDSDLPELANSLQSRLDHWQEQYLKKTELEKELLKFNSARKEIEAIIATQNQSLIGIQQRLATRKNGYQALVSERQHLFGSKKPDTEQTRLENAVTAAEQAEKTLSTECTSVKEHLQAVRIRITELTKRVKTRVTELKTLETDFSRALHTSGFINEQSFIAQRLSAVERNQLMAKAEQLDALQTSIKARKQDKQNRLSKEIDKKITPTPAPELVTRQQEQSEILKQSRDHIAGLRHKLSENRTALARIKEKQTLIDGQMKECRRWDNLHLLIGSADGKKYRNFAQGLTFEMMVFNANQQLDKMTDRYLLIRDTEQPLELNVVDKYQAGEIRSTKNLSGGESFIVSLALALGLSKMASRKVRVDSLFLDEGFGTLDEDALETALDTLANLQQNNKLIGIISHVPALKERISTRINILPASGGKSTITGPGCRKLSG